MLRHLTLSAFRSAEAKSGGVVPTIPSYKKVQRLQTLFLTDNGRMVWEKTGSDRALYSTSMGIIVVGIPWVVYKVFRWIFPKQ